jgi:hypothetical protein
VLSAVIASQSSTEHVGPSAELPPLPARPWKNARPPPASDETKQTHRARLSIEVPTSPDTRPDVIPAPFLGEKRAGYFPWAGRHPEDVLNEVNVKQGYYDRPPNPPERELNSARVPLYAAFKHKSGIDSLSALFSLVLEAKNTHGLLGSASTFKPPPRVTLAEAKRKSWIADLADSSVHLRRLSRTIPQGIRGHILLEQCIQMSVPLSRAIWFAKCVGANEIRTLKRKGTTTAVAAGAETKWLREWTLQVEQFIETILSQCGEENWKADVQYTIRLTTRLYLENLLDRDHFLDWMAKSLSASDNKRLPFWLMILHIYRNDIVRYRKRAKIVVEGLVQKYEVLSNNKDEMVQALAAKLRNAIRGFALSRPECFINPDRWPVLRGTLQKCLESEHVQEAQIFDRLERVNQRCMGSNRQQYLARPEPYDRVIAMLDETTVPYDVDLLSSDLLSSCPSPDQLVIASLEWATSIFRSGTARVYIVARLLRKWQRQGVDISSPVLDFMATSAKSSSNCDFDALHHLVAELSRSKTFPTSMYMQGLSVRGLPRPDTVETAAIEHPLLANAKSVIQQKATDHEQVLMELSLLGEKSHLIHQRNVLLTRAGLDTDAETEALSELQTTLERWMVNAAQDLHFATYQVELISLFSGWNWTVRSKLSHWLRAFIAQRVKDGKDVTEQNPLQDSSSIVVRNFQISRVVLETLGDLATLADVIGMYSTLDNEQLHACLTETVTRHTSALSAIGALRPLQIRLYQLYMSLRNVKLTMPLFATALLDLCTISPNSATQVRLLQQDLVRGDRGRAIAASSPFSDGIAESLQQAESTFVEDFEAVLQSEPSMNEQTMSSLFSLLADRISKHTSTGDDPILFTYCQLMARLRLYRKSQGDRLVKLWLRKAGSTGPIEFTQKVVLSLIGTGALTVESLVEVMDNNKNLVGLLSEETVRNHDCHYSVSTKWAYFAHQSPVKMVNLVGGMLPVPQSIVEDRLIYSSLISQLSNGLTELTPNGIKLLGGYLKTLLSGKENGESEIQHTLALTSTLSLSHVQLALQLAQATSSGDSGEVATLIKDLVLDSGNNAAGRHVPSLLQGAGNEIASATRNATEEHLLELLPKLSTGKPFETEPFDPEAIERAIEAAYRICQGSSSVSKCLSHLIDKLSQLLKYLGYVNPPPSPVKATATSPTSATTPLLPSIASQLFNPSSPLEPAPPRSLSPTLLDYLRVLLQLLCLLRPSSSSPPRPAPSSGTGKQPAAPQPPRSQSDQIKVLIYLASLVTQPILASPRSVFPDNNTDVETANEVASFAYDVMATYVDDLTDDGRALCAKILKDKLSPPSQPQTQPQSQSQAQPTSSPAESVTLATTARASANRMRYLFGSVAMFGSEIPGAEDMGKGLLVSKEGKCKGEWRPRVWEVLNCNGVKDGETSLGLGLFGARRG